MMIELAVAIGMVFSAQTSQCPGEVREGESVVCSSWELVAACGETAVVCHDVGDDVSNELVSSTFVLLADGSVQAWY